MADKKLKTLILNVDKDDPNYQKFQNLKVLKAGDIKNKIIYYNLDEKIETLTRTYLGPKSNLYSIKPIRLEKIFQDIKSLNSNIVLAGQTKLAENCVFNLKNPEILIIRYSGFYKAKFFYRKLVPAEIVGYSLDCLKDLDLILDFLQNPAVMKEVANKNKQNLEKAIQEFNETNEKAKINPIKKLGYFKFLWDKQSKPL